MNPPIYKRRGDRFDTQLARLERLHLHQTCRAATRVRTLRHPLTITDQSDVSRRHGDSPADLAEPCITDVEAILSEAREYVGVSKMSRHPAQAAGSSLCPRD